LYSLLKLREKDGVRQSKKKLHPSLDSLHFKIWKIRILFLLLVVSTVLSFLLVEEYTFVVTLPKFAAVLFVFPLFVCWKNGGSRQPVLCKASHSN
jgi:hypothetical protein